MKFGKTVIASQEIINIFDFKNSHNDETNITTIETAIILIAFIVIAAVFAFTILSASTASTERGQGAIYSSFENSQSLMGVEGTIVAKQASAGTSPSSNVIFTLALAPAAIPTT